VIRDYLEKSLVDHTSETFYKGVYPLLGGHMFTVDLNNIKTIEPKEWYKLKLTKNSMKFSENIHIFKKLFKKSLEFRFRSDVPVGACLSGGLDSSSIVSYSANIYNQIDINVFNARFKEKEYDESYFADLVVDKYDNVLMNSCSLKSGQISVLLTKVLYHQDEPFSDFGIFSQWEVMKSANEKGIPVLLDGQGGDELLAGYRKYYAFYLKELLSNLRFFTFFKELFFLIKNKQFNFFDKEGIKRYLNFSVSNKALSKKTLNLNSEIDFGLGSSKSLVDSSIQDIKYFSFPPLLRYEDRNSMAFSIETRVPFMDYQLVEFSLGLPAECKIKNGYTKYILRESMIGILPEEIRKRISKLGFSTPQAEWLNKNVELREYFMHYFKKMNNPYLNNEFILNDFINYPNSKLSSTEFSKYLIFDFWYQINFNKKDK
jgi:asparagine synthase (glutamine-hydrolysing)